MSSQSASMINGVELIWSHVFCCVEMVVEDVFWNFTWITGSVDCETSLTRL